MPAVRKFTDSREELKEIIKIAGRFTASGYNSLGIICKTQKQADMLYDRFREQAAEKRERVYLLTTQSAAFLRGVVIASAHMAKGLEFDQVIVPFASAVNYRSEVDRRMLYIACTRAMHILDVTCTGKLTGFI